MIAPETVYASLSLSEAFTTGLQMEEEFRPARPEEDTDREACKNLRYRVNAEIDSRIHH